jgi:hypothetical protein
MTYEELSDGLVKAPATWIPALFQTLTNTAIRKKVFKVGKVSEFVAGVEQKLVLQRLAGSENTTKVAGNKYLEHPIAKKGK